MPLPNTRIIPAGWSEHHRPAMPSAWNAACSITRATGTGTADVNGQWTPSPATSVYSGPCRLIEDASQELDTPQGGVRLTSRRYLLQLRAETPARVGDFVKVTSAPNAVLVSRGFRVESVSVSAESWTTDLHITEIEGSDA